MSDASDWQRQFEALSKGWWNAFTPPAASAAPAWGQVPGWSGPFAGQGRVDDTTQRLQQQWQDYLGLMRGVAEQAAGGAGPEALARAWREAMAGVAGANPMLATLSSMTGGGARALHEMADAAQAALAPLQSQMQAALGVPPVGQMREHQQRLQSLARAQAELQQANQRYAALLQEASERAFAVFEKKLAERAAPGRQLDSARALYDLWIDAAEEAYAELALTPRFGEVFGQLVNAQMRVRQGVQQQVEQSCSELGMPTRREIDAAHRRVVDLQRRLAALEAQSGSAQPESPPHGAAGVTPTQRGTAGASAAKPQRRAGTRASAKPQARASTRAAATPAGNSGKASPRVAGKSSKANAAAAKQSHPVPKAPAAKAGTAKAGARKKTR